MSLISVGAAAPGSGGGAATPGNALRSPRLRLLLRCAAGARSALARGHAEPSVQMCDITPCKGSTCSRPAGCDDEATRLRRQTSQPLAGRARLHAILPMFGGACASACLLYVHGSRFSLRRESSAQCGERHRREFSLPSRNALPCPGRCSTTHRAAQAWGRQPLRSTLQADVAESCPLACPLTRVTVGHRSVLRSLQLSSRCDFHASLCARAIKRHSCGLGRAAGGSSCRQPCAASDAHEPKASVPTRMRTSAMPSPQRRAGAPLHEAGLAGGGAATSATPGKLWPSALALRSSGLTEAVQLTVSRPLAAQVLRDPCTVGLSPRRYGAQPDVSRW